jgi:hypothetical protein
MRRKASELVDDTEKADYDIKLAKAKSDIDRLKKSDKSNVKYALDVEKKLDALLAIQGEPAMQRFVKMPRSKPDGVAVICPCSDWHCEERVFPAAIHNLNSFDLEEAEKRIKRLFSKIVELIEWQNHFAPVVELWLPLLGDLMTGYLHDDLVESNSLTPVEACVFLRDQVAGGIDFLVKETKLPIAIPTCNGNHGRTTQKMRIKTSAKNSYEWLLYKTLEKLYQGHERVAFQVGEGYLNIQNIMGRKVRFHHGDGIRYQGGVGGISIPVNKAIGQWDKVEMCDLDVFGHYHQFRWDYPKWVCCGSLMGYTEFALSIKADWQHPTQTFIVLDKDYGVTNAFPIFLTPPKRKQ